MSYQTSLVHKLVLSLAHFIAYFAFWYFFQVPVTLVPIVLCVLLVLVSINDFLRYEIPDTCVLLLFTVGVFAHWENQNNFLPYLFSSAFWFCIFGAMSRLAKLRLGQDALGFGDVKLIAAIGFLYGAIPTIYVVLFASVAAIVALLILQRASEGEERFQGIAFGPFLSLSTWVIYVNLGAFQ